jgi:hypothetical protein
MKKIKYISYVTALVWMMIAFITVGSIYLSATSWVINLTMSIIFALISIYVFYKERNFILLISSINNNTHKTRAISYELLLLIIILLVGIVALSGVYHRVFGEQFPVFG